MTFPEGPMAAQLLLVEDDDAIADALCLHLSQAGFAVHREADGLAGRRAIERCAWDLVLLDLTCPVPMAGICAGSCASAGLTRRSS